MISKPLNNQRVSISSLGELRSWVHQLSQSLGPKTCILLSGEMGSGKTQFVRYFVESLGSNEACSPTFAIHNMYTGSSCRIDHVDLYRLESESELEATGFWDLFERSEGYILIEWANRIDKRLLPKDWSLVCISITEESEDQRFIVLTR